MIRLFFLSLAIFPTTIFCQETKKVKNQTLYYYEEYHVVKANKNVKEGRYFKLTQFKQDSLASGTYVKNEKSGTWRFYERGILIARGNYENGKKLGAWDYFENGSLTFKFDHTTDSVLFSAYRQGVPQYPGFTHAVYENIQYPMQALRMGVMGRVSVSFVVNEDGTTGDYKIEKDIGAGCGEELLRVLKLLNRAWLPGELNGKKISDKVVVVGEFKLLDNGDKTIVVRKI